MRGEFRPEFLQVCERKTRSSFGRSARSSRSSLLRRSPTLDRTRSRERSKGVRECEGRKRPHQGYKGSRFIGQDPLNQRGQSSRAQQRGASFRKDKSEPPNKRMSATLPYSLHSQSPTLTYFISKDTVPVMSFGPFAPSISHCRTRYLYIRARCESLSAAMAARAAAELLSTLSMEWEVSVKTWPVSSAWLSSSSIESHCVLPASALNPKDPACRGIDVESDMMSPLRGFVRVRKDVPPCVAQESVRTKTASPCLPQWLRGQRPSCCRRYPWTQPAVRPISRAKLMSLMALTESVRTTTMSPISSLAQLVQHGQSLRLARVRAEPQRPHLQCEKQSGEPSWVARERCVQV